jgi:5-methylthioadenosine/S-adenosylhomocysteine deaminase
VSRPSSASVVCFGSVSANDGSASPLISPATSPCVILFPRVATGDVGLLSGYGALRIATLGGAHALGMENDIGSLEVGKKADIILVDVTTPWCNPIRKENFITNIVFNANGSDVTDVFVDGRPVVVDREVRTVDRLAVQRDCQARADRLWGEASRHWG